MASEGAAVAVVEVPAVVREALAGVRASIEELARYERSFDGVLAGQNSVVSLPGGYVRLVTVTGPGRGGVEVRLVTLPRASMFDPLAAQQVAAEIRDGNGDRAEPVNYREAIRRERVRLADLESVLAGGGSWAASLVEQAEEVASAPAAGVAVCPTCGRT